MGTNDIKDKRNINMLLGINIEKKDLADLETSSSQDRKRGLLSIMFKLNTIMAQWCLFIYDMLDMFVSFETPCRV